MNVLQTLGIEELCRQPLEVPLSVQGGWVAQLLGPKRAKAYYHKICNTASGLVYTLCAAFQPQRVALSCLGRVLHGPGLLGKVPHSPESAARPTG